MVNACNHTKCISLNNQKSGIQTTLINLHPNEYSQEFHYNPFTIKLDRCVGSCNSLNGLSNKVCNNKTEDLNLSVFNMIKGINEANTLTKLNTNLKEQNVIKVNSRITINVDKTVKKHFFCEKDHNCNPTTCNSENGKYLASNMYDSAIICDEIIDVNETNFNKKI